MKFQDGDPAGFDAEALKDILSRNNCKVFENADGSSFVEFPLNGDSGTIGSEGSIYYHLILNKKAVKLTNLVFLIVGVFGSISVAFIGGILEVPLAATAIAVVASMVAIGRKSYRIFIQK